jgi:SSS family solute:Na+ symporter
VAWTDFIQMIVLVVGLAIIAVFSGNLAGGSDKVLAMVSSRELWKFLPEPSFTDFAFFVAAGHHDDAGLHPAAGRVPARDVGQGRKDRPAMAR